MPTTTSLKKLNEIMATLLKAQSFTAALGSIPDDSVWVNTVAGVLNGNALLVVPGVGTNQITVKASAMVLTVTPPATAKLSVLADTGITSVLSIPIAARTDGPNHFFSQAAPFNEGLVLLSGKFNHIYACRDLTKPTQTALGVVSNASEAVPSQPTVVTNIGNGDSTTARLAVCYVDLTGKVTWLKTFPAIFGQVAAVPQDAIPSYIDWTKIASATPTTAIQVVFTFPAGTGTGPIGEACVKLGSDIVAYMPISPQLLKDADIPFVLKWNIMVGEPGAFI